MTWYVALTASVVIGQAVGLAAAIIGVIGGVADNINGVHPRRLGLSEVAAMREASLTWFLLPAVAYVLSVVTNLGTSAIEREGIQSPTGWKILFFGFLALELLAGFAVIRAGRRKDEWRSLSDWRLLWSEVRDWEEAGKAVGEVRLNRAEEQCSVLDAKDDRATRLGREASKLMPAPELDWRQRPIWGILTLHNHGHRVPVAAHKWIHWMWLSRPYRAIVVLQTLSLLVCGLLSFFWSTPDVPNALFIVFVLMSLLAGTLGLASARASLIYHARLNARNEELRDETKATIARLRNAKTTTVPTLGQQHERPKLVEAFRRLFG